MIGTLAMPLWQNVLQLLAVAFIFVLILVATYFATRWIAKSGMVQMQSKNISVIETFKIAPNKYIQIIQLGTKYYAISVSKEHINFLTELDEEQLNFENIERQQQVLSFKEVMEKVLPKKKK